MRFQRKLQLVVLASISLVFVSHDSANAEDQSSQTTESFALHMLVIDYDYTPYDYVCPYDYGVAVVRLNPLIRGFHPDEYTQPAESPYHYAETHRLPLKTFDDYLAVLDHIMRRAAERGAVGMKSTLAYRRTLHYEAVTKSQAAEAFGKRRGELTPSQIKAFEDYVFRQFCELSEKHVLPLQIHTGYVLSQSNPLLLENLIRDYPKTTFILFHGGYPWVGETAAMALHFPKNVWIDSNWLPTLSYHMAKRAYHEWLDVIPANRIMWGSDTLHAEGLYGATETTRQCLAEVLAERVTRRQVLEAGARHIGEQILRESALLAFPRLRQHVARRSQQRNQQKDQQPTEQPPAPSAGR